MKPPSIVRRLAKTQLAEAYHWYAARATGLGAEFLRAFEVVCMQIERQPRSGAIVFLDYRRILMRKFPYGAFYVLEGDFVVVAAVFNLARHPRTIQRQLKQ